MPSAKVDYDTPAGRIVQRCGGLVKFCNAFQPPKPTSTVWRWLESGLIPAKHQAEVMEVGKRLKVRIKPADFMPSARVAA